MRCVQGNNVRHKRKGYLRNSEGSETGIESHGARGKEACRGGTRAIQSCPLFESLSALPSTNCARLTHPFFPRHNVRIKKSTFCDGSVNAYAGYIDVDACHSFFYFFQSRRDPSKDDVIFWTNGDPGCSLPWVCSWCWVRKLKYHPQSRNEIILSVFGFRTRSTGSEL